MKAIILAAGMGRRIRDYTEIPKCLIKIGKKPLLQRYIEALSSEGIEDIVIVLGYKESMVRELLKKIHFKGKIIYNPYFTKGSILSLISAKDELNNPLILMDGDVFFEKSVLERLTRSLKNNIFLIDTTSKGEGEEYMIGIKEERVVKMGRGLNKEFDCVGEWVGFLKMERDSSIILKSLLSGNFKEDMGYEEAISLLLDKISFGYELVDGLKWVEIDFIEDVRRAESFVKNGF